jgi:hypothetical protein
VLVIATSYTAAEILVSRAECYHVTGRAISASPYQGGEVVAALGVEAEPAHLPAAVHAVQRPCAGPASIESPW